MAEEILIQRWCDRHLDMDPPRKLEGKEYARGIDGKWYKIDLCPECFAPLAAAEQLLLNFGRALKPGESPRSSHSRGTVSPDGRRGPQPVGARDVPCLLCPKAYGADSGYVSHLKKDHGFTGSGMRDLYGKDCPICDSEHGILGQHVRKEHDQPHVAAAFVFARDHLDDPHGIVERQMEKWGA